MALVSISSTVDEVIRAVSSLFNLLRKNFERKKAPKNKTNDFLRSFYAHENLLPLLFLFACLCFC